MEETIDPTVKLTKFLKEDKLEEAFHMALSVGDVDVVAWLCNQVELSHFPMLSRNFVKHSDATLLNRVGFKLEEKWWFLML